MHKNVEITLTSSRGGSQPKTFAAQTVEISHEPDTKIVSVDGRVSIGHHPSTLRWYGGSTNELDRDPKVRIVDHHGRVLIDATVNRHHRTPREIDGYLIFDVF